MGDDARRALRPRGVAIRSGFGRTPGRADVRGWMTELRSQMQSVVSDIRHPSCDLRPTQILRRVDRGRALADFEMQLRRGDVAGLTGMRNHLAAFHGLAALDQNVAGMRVGGDETIGVANQDQIAIALELAPGISYDAVF